MTLSCSNEAWRAWRRGILGGASVLSLLSLLACGRVAMDPAGTGPSTGGSSAGGAFATGGGDAVTGGMPSTGGSACAGSPVCTAGETICDPDLGVLMACDEGCGAWKATSTACVRELAMDQESDVACAIYGERDLICFSPGGFGSYEAKVPAGTRTVILPDDSMDLVLGGDDDMCFLKASGELECRRGGSVLTKEDCTAAALSDQGGRLLCTSCGGNFTCEGAPSGSLPESVESFAVGDGSFAYIWEGSIRTAWGDVLTFSGLKDLARSNVGDLCGIETSGGVRCVIEGDTLSSPIPFTEVAVGMDARLCGVDAGNHGKCVVLSSTEPNSTPFLTLDGVRHFRTSAMKACALTLDGHVRCFSHDGSELSVPELLR